MTVRTAVPVGAPIWIDLSTSDQPVSRAFYTALLGWDAEEPDLELGGYLNFSLDGERVAGCVPAMPEAPPLKVRKSVPAAANSSRTRNTSAVSISP